MDGGFAVPVFVSSPSDCEAERAEILDVVADLNVTLGPERGLRFDAFDSRRLYPTVGNYAQAGINRQLREYEIYVGVWRERRGTPTPVAASGTEEELDDALRRYDAERRPAIMAYFWEGGEFDDIKLTLKNRGRYFHLYSAPADLGELFRQHLADFIRREYRKPGHSSTIGSPDRAAGVHLTLDVHRPGVPVDRRTFGQRTVAVGRNRDVNDLVLTDPRVHREQGLFVYDGIHLHYVDLAGDAQVVGDEPGAGGLHRISEEDAVTLPGGTRIVVRAIVG